MILSALAVGLCCHDEVSSGKIINFPKDKHCDSHYTFNLIPRNWLEARINCRIQGGDLVNIETAEEQEYLKRVVDRYRQKPLVKAQIARQNWFGFWTSGSDTKTEGKFVWSANGSPVTFKYWDKGQPDNHGGEDFIEIFAINGRWNDAPGYFQMFSICEFGTEIL